MSLNVGIQRAPKGDPLQCMVGRPVSSHRSIAPSDPLQGSRAHPLTGVRPRRLARRATSLGLALR